MGSLAGFEPLDESVRARPAGAFDRWLLSLLYKSLGDAPVRLVLWDGTEHRPAARPVATLHVRDRKTLVGMLLDPDLNVGDAYASGRMEVEGDLVAANEGVFRALHSGGYRRPCPGGASRARAGTACARPARTSTTTTTSATTSTGSGSTARCSTPAPTSPRPTATLEEAQVAKMEHVCRKLGLRPGERVRGGGLRLGVARPAHGPDGTA